MTTEHLAPIASNGLSAILKRNRAATEPTPDVSAEQQVFTDPAFVAVASTFKAVGGSRKGYQFGGRIIRPNAFGVYVPDNSEETAYFNELVTAGVMTAATTAQAADNA